MIDEFAALAKEVPEFVDGVVDVAQRGRSLGLHLIMATQRPAGVIKDNLRANTNLRVALRMADETDSQDVLGDRAAASFSSDLPGRAAVKTDAGRLTLFQSAFPGARTPRGEVQAPVDVHGLAFGAGRPWQLPETGASTDGTPTDIERVVRTVREAADRGGVPRPRPPWLSPLASVYHLGREMRRDTELVLGFQDVPESQDQQVGHFRPDEDGNVLYIGTGGSGKTTALRSLAVAASVTPGGGLVHVYGLDFAGGQLSSLESLSTVGSIVSGDDEDRVRRLLRWLGDVAEERSSRFSAVSASRLDQYRTATGTPDEPRILVLVDGLSAFRAAFEGSGENLAAINGFQRLLSEGAAVGIHFAVTADRPGAVPSSMLAAFRRRLVLRLADDDGYLQLGVPRGVLSSASPAGRAVDVDTGLETQIAVLLPRSKGPGGGADPERQAALDTSSAAQARAIAALDATVGPRVTRVPHRIGTLPSLLTGSELPPEWDGRPVLGMADNTLAPLSFEARGLVMLSGPGQSGRSNALLWMASAVRAAVPDIRLFHLSARRSPVASSALWDAAGDTWPAAREVIERAVAAQEDPSVRVGVFVEHYPEFLQTEVEQRLLALVQACKRNGHLLVAEGEGPSWTAPWPLLMEIRNARAGLLLQPDQGDGDTLLRTTLPRCRRSDFPLGRGFWVRGGRAEKVQVPLVAWGADPMDTLVDDRESSNGTRAKEVRA